MNANVKAGTDGEWLDIVNAQDEVIGRERRREVHRRKLWHRAVHIMVFNAAGQLFLQKRSLAKDESPGLWTLSCSGHVDAGEGYDKTAVRELGEELGLIPAAPPVRWLRIEACVETGWEFSWVYRLQAEGPFVLHPAEIDAGRWVTPTELDQSMAAQPGIYCTAFRMIWGRVRAWERV